MLCHPRLEHVPRNQLFRQAQFAVPSCYDGLYESRFVTREASRSAASKSCILKQSLECDLVVEPITGVDVSRPKTAGAKCAPFVCYPVIRMKFIVSTLLNKEAIVEPRLIGISFWTV